MTGTNGAPGAVAVLANPRAARRPGLLAAVLRRLGGHGHDVRLLVAGTSGQAEAACRAAVADGAAALVAVGGDGTVHRALQAVAATGVPLGVVPAGTGNDLARETGVPLAPVAAAEAIAAALVTGRTRRIDLARMTRVTGTDAPGGTPAGVPKSGAAPDDRPGPDASPRWFGAVLAAGFDAVVNERANRMSWPRGARRYDVAILLELARLRSRRYTLTLDGVPRELDAVLVAVGNTASYGGGMRICPAADPTDGLLDVFVGGPIGRAELVRIKPRIYRGTHVSHPGARTYRAREVRIDVAGIVGYADGERAYPLPVVVSCVPGALRLLGALGAAGPVSS